MTHENITCSFVLFLLGPKTALSVCEKDERGWKLFLQSLWLCLPREIAARQDRHGEVSTWIVEVSAITFGFAYLFKKYT